MIIPWKIPYSITVNGKLKPIREFIITKTADGSIHTTEYNHLQNISRSGYTYQIERGEYAGFELNDIILNKKTIFPEDTLGRIVSSELKFKLIDLNNRLLEAKMNLNYFQSGDKASLVALAEQKIRLYREQIQNQARILDRKKKLFETKLISEDDLDLEKNILNSIKADLANAETEYEQLSTGAKPEQIDYLKSRITGLEDERYQVKEIFNSLILFAPFSGRVIHPVSMDTLLIVADPYSVIVFPVPVEYAGKIRTGLQLTIENIGLTQTGSKITGQIENLNPMIVKLGAADAIMVTGIINERYKDLPLNRMVSCDIILYEVTIRNYIFRFLESVFRAMV